MFIRLVGVVNDRLDYVEPMLGFHLSGFFSGATAFLWRLR